MTFKILNIAAWLVGLVLLTFALGQDLLTTAGGKKEISVAPGSATATAPPADTTLSAMPALSQDNTGGHQFELAKSETGDYAKRDSAAVAANDSAVTLVESGHLREAVDLLTFAVERDSTYARAFYNRGVAHSRIKSINAATHDYQRAIAIRPDYYSPIYNLGLLYLAIGRNEEAVTWLTKATQVRRSAISASAHYNLGLAHRRLGDDAKATAAYREALRLRPAYIEARYNLALILMRGDHYGDAAKEFVKAASLGFDKAKLYINLGVCYSRTGEDKRAIDAYEQALRRDSTSARIWFNLGIAERRADRFDAARQAYAHAVALDSTMYEAHFNLAVLYADAAEPDSALTHYRDAVLLNPSYTKAHYNMAHVYSDLKAYDSAAACYRRVVALDPENTRALFNLGLTSVRAGDLEAAVQAYSRVVDVDPVYARALTGLGSVYMDLEQYDSAYVYYNRVVRLTNTPASFFNRARCSLRLGDINAARTDYQQAIELRPDYAKALHNLGLLEKSAGHEDAAVALLLQAIATGDASWRSHWRLGQIYAQRGKTDDAGAEYRKAAALNPSSSAFWEEYERSFGNAP